jgi:hypothetical protein
MEPIPPKSCRKWDTELRDIGCVLATPRGRTSWTAAGRRPVQAPARWRRGPGAAMSDWVKTVVKCRRRVYHLCAPRRARSGPIGEG